MFHTLNQSSRIMLLNLATEIIIQILTSDILNYSDYFQIILTCHQLHAIGIPLLYRQLAITPLERFIDVRSNTTVNLEQLNGAFDLQPAYLSLVHAAHIVLSHRKSLKHAAWLFHLVSDFESLQSWSLACPGIGIHIINKPLSHFLKKCKYLSFLRHITIDLSQNNFKVSAINGVFSVPNLDFFVLKNLLEVTDEPDQASDYPPTKITKLDISSSPAAIAHSCALLARHPALESLSWTTYSYQKPKWHGSDISQTLAPLKRRLVNLRLAHRFLKTLAPGTFPSHPDPDAHMDFSDFTALRVLEIQEHLAFPRRKPILPNDLYDRLPPSLEHLTVSSPTSLRLLPCRTIGCEQNANIPW